MPTSILGPYFRTIVTVSVIAAALVFSFTYARNGVYVEIQPLFEWMETTWFGYVGKTWGAAFATIQAGHLIGLAVLGGCVLVSDGRLLGVVLTDVPHRIVVDRADAVFRWAPIADELKCDDEEILRNSIHLRWIGVRRDLKAVFQHAAIADDWHRQSATSAAQSTGK